MGTWVNAGFSLAFITQPSILRGMKQISLTILALIALFSSALAKTYVVQPGDTLYSVARSNNISLAQLMVFNKGITTNLKPGQQLNLPEAARVTQTTATKTRNTQNNPGNSSVIQAAYRNLGARYVWGASRPGAFDCSGFTMYVMRQSGISLPHSSSAQFRMGRSVSRSNLQAGDLMFFSLGTRGVVGHVGLYIGNGRMIHASTPSTGVIVSSLSEPYYASRYLGARRVM
jgi:peptidoglycan DL-endopeptidase LytE